MLLSFLKKKNLSITVYVFQVDVGVLTSVRHPFFSEMFVMGIHLRHQFLCNSRLSCYAQWQAILTVPYTRKQ